MLEIPIQLKKKEEKKYNPLEKKSKKKVDKEKIRFI